MGHGDSGPGGYLTKSPAQLAAEKLAQASAPPTPAPPPVGAAAPGLQPYQNPGDSPITSASDPRYQKGTPEEIARGYSGNPGRTVFGVEFDNFYMVGDGETSDGIGGFSKTVVPPQSPSSQILKKAQAGVDDRFQGLLDFQASQAVNPASAAGTQFNYQNQALQGNELIQSQQLGAADQATTYAQTATPDVASPTSQGPSNYDAFTDYAMAQMTPEQLSTLSPEAIAEAAQGTVSEDSTVQFQLAQLLDQFKEGEVPPWAAGAIRNANAAMAQRGMMGSSMGAAAVNQSAMESALPIAQQDAQTNFQMQVNNLQNRQQAVMFNAQQFAQLDMTNLTNAQQASTINMQARTQKLLGDQAAVNASQQFNAQTEAQTEQFFANLGSTVATNNANRLSAMDAANVDQANSQQRFNASVRDAREKFNMQARMEIDQSNVMWRRQINTQNSAMQNQTNMMNTQNAFNMSQASQANLWQQYRDEAHWAMTSAENGLSRQHNIAMAALGQVFTQDNASAAGRSARNQQLGAFAINLANNTDFNALGNGISNLFS